MNYGGMNLQVIWPELRCFGCDTATSQELKRYWSEAAPLPLLVGKGNIRGNAIETHIIGFTEEAVVKAADEAGWRKITVYGRTLYVCPNCAKNRERPEWARRLTEEDAK